jgi:hypothetical protein
MARLPDPRIGELTFRGGISLKVAHKPPNYEPAAAFLDISDFKHVEFLSAVSEQTKAPEFPVDDEGQQRRRGLLSFAFAGALKGTEAELSKGFVTREDLVGSIRQVVYQYAKGSQHTVDEPDSQTADLDEKLLLLEPVPPPPPPPAAALRVKVINGSLDASVKIDAKAPFEVVQSDPAELVWDKASEEVLVMPGDVIAHGIDQAKLAAVIDRTAVVAAVNKLTEAGAQAFFLLPDDKVHHDGDPITFRATGLKGKFPILFNVNGNGTIDYVFPRFNRPNGLPDDNPQVQDDPYDLKLTVSPPFGADFIVALVFDERHADLEAKIADLAKKPAAGEAKKPGAGALLQILNSLAGSAGMRVGAVSSFSDQASAAEGKSP